MTALKTLFYFNSCSMSHTSKIFDEQPIRVQNLNGFDLSHLNSGTAYVGTLTPVLCRLLMQETKFSLGCALQVELPPLATQAFGRIDAHIEAFFVPCSILYGGWKQFISNNPETSFIATQQGYEQYDLPLWGINDAGVYADVSSLDAANYCLLDYIGCGIGINALYTAAQRVWFNMMPLLCYHLIWNSFYRNPQVTRTIFAVNPDTAGPGFTHNVAFIHHSYFSYLVGNSSPEFDSSVDTTFPDGISVFSLRQRNYPNDYFTAGSLKPFAHGTTPTLNFTVDLNTGDGGFTISSLRAFNSLAKFEEANNYDPTYRGISRANYGRTPSDADRDEPIYLGRLVVPVYQKGVFLQDAGSVPASSGGNPFIDGTITDSLLGTKAAHASFNGSGEICKNFRAGCWGYLFANFSLVPHAQYSYGIERHLTAIEQGDFARPLLQSVGMDAVKDYEVFATPTNVVSKSDFSYIGRYSWMKYVNDTVHGEMRPGKTLQSFIIQRRMYSAPSFNTAFMEIPISAIDAILPVDSATMKFTCWYEVYWVLKAVMPLAEFCIPTLGELLDTHTIRVKQGGSRL